MDPLPQPHDRLFRFVFGEPEQAGELLRAALPPEVCAAIDWASLKARLDAALLPATAASGPDDLPNLPDPFPLWRRAEDAA